MSNDYIQTNASLRAENYELRAENSRLREERDAAFAMSKCECETNEACANLVGLHNEIARLREQRDRLAKAVDGLPGTMRNIQAVLAEIEGEKK